MHRGVRRPVSRVLSSPESDGWPFLWDARCRAPRATDPGGDAETPLPVARRAAPIWSCSRWGLPCRFRCRSRGGLLPHRFTLTGPANRAGGLFSVALSLGSPPPDVIRHRVSVEPGLSSPNGCPSGAAIQPSDPRAYLVLALDLVKKIGQRRVRRRRHKPNLSKSQARRLVLLAAPTWSRRSATRPR